MHWGHTAHVVSSNGKEQAGHWGKGIQYLHLLSELCTAQRVLICSIQHYSLDLALPGQQGFPASGAFSLGVTMCFTAHLRQARLVQQSRCQHRVRLGFCHVTHFILYRIRAPTSWTKEGGAKAELIKPKIFSWREYLLLQKKLYWIYRIELFNFFLNSSVGQLLEEWELYWQDLQLKEQKHICPPPKYQLFCSQPKET